MAVRRREDGLSRGRALLLWVFLPCVLLVSCGGSGAEEPGDEVDIAAEPAPDPDAPGVHHIGPNRYEAVIYAFEGGFDPAEIRVPAGAEITFRTRSVDIPHGLYIEGPGIKLLPVMDEFRTAVHTFTAPGEHTFFCDEYCGGGHVEMRGLIIVE